MSEAKKEQQNVTVIAEEIGSACAKKLEEQLGKMAKSAANEVLATVLKEIEIRMGGATDDDFPTEKDAIDLGAVKLTACDGQSLLANEFPVFVGLSTNGADGHNYYSIVIVVTNFGNIATGGHRSGGSSISIDADGKCTVCHGCDGKVYVRKSSFIPLNKKCIAKLQEVQHTSVGLEGCVTKMIEVYALRNPSASDEHRSWKNKHAAEKLAASTRAREVSIEMKIAESNRNFEKFERERNVFSTERKSFEARVARLVRKEKEFEALVAKKISALNSAAQSILDASQMV